jgi:hypothetical protein
MPVQVSTSRAQMRHRGKGTDFIENFWRIARG